MSPKSILFLHGPLTKGRWKTLHHLRRSLERRGLLEPCVPLMCLSDPVSLRHIPKAMELFSCDTTVLLCDKVGPWLTEAQTLHSLPLFCFYEKE